MVMNVDYAPTILDFANVAVPSGMQGRSLRPIVEGSVPPDWRETVYYAYYEDSWKLHGKGEEAMAEPYQYFTPHRIGPHRGVRTDRYKLIHYYSEGEYRELFDLVKDPDELRNVYGTSEYDEVSRSMEEMLQGQRALYNDLD